MIVKTVLIGVAVLVLVGVVVLTVVGAHWYVWRRLVRDTTTAASRARRVGTAVVLTGPLLLLGTTVAELASAPFTLIRIIAWPGYLWGALFVYLLLALAVGEPIRALALRWFDRGRMAREPESPAEVGSISESPVRGGAAPDSVVIAGPGREFSAEPGSEPEFSAAAVSAPESLMGVGSGPEDPTETVSASESVDGTVAASESSVRAESASESVAASGSAPECMPATVSASEPVAAPEPVDGTVASEASMRAASESLAASGSAPEPVAGAGSAPESSAEIESGRESLPDAATSADSPPPRVPRRVFVARVMGGAAVAAAATTVGIGAHGVLNGPSVKRVAVPLAKLPRRADGFRIAVVSDVHLGPILGRGFAERVVRIVNDTRPDLIAVVGDLVDGSVEHLRSAVEPLAGLRARHGAFFVTGNHEYFSGAEQWVEHVQELGMHLLANARTELPGFDLAGVNDVQGERTGHGPDFAKALGDRDRTRTAVLLAHQPVLIEDAVAHGVDLQLSGHTHGGQLWPGNYLAGLANPTVAGLERYGDTQLYVSRGAGAWGPPVRVGAPADITVVELVSPQV
ncbi:metallophosphoesterase [Nocardia beijingensis]|uniref:metallophosphoesterase n=1 Tax=Nocardia beijingensis TaxID=95162 RepID=UPI001FD34C4A|nr:metallophosphoesterase [Nocardia beijingensis]